jgi:uncharacterized membrane protein
MAEKTNTTMGLSQNIASALCYVPVLGWIFAIVVLVVEKDPSVKWNAWQSVLLSAVVFVAVLAFTSTIILAFLVPVINIAVLIVDLILAVKSYNGSTFKLPVISSWADKIVKKV